MKCFLCQKSNFAEKYCLPTKKILECKNDGVVMAQPTDKNKVYGEEYFSNEPNSFNQSYFLSKLRTIQKLTAKSQPSILDIGCGWGDFEEVLEKERVPYLGIDINKESIEICRKKGLNCIQATIKPDSGVVAYAPPQNDVILASEARPESPSKFDAATMFQVIEHLKNPLPLLKSARKLLKKNRVLLITTPNNDSPLRTIFGPKWSVYSEPSHYVFYNKKTLRIVLEKAGYKNIQVKNDSWRFLSLKYVLNRLGQIGFPNFNFSFLTFNFPIPTDPWGDIEAIAINN